MTRTINTTRKANRSGIAVLRNRRIRPRAAHARPCFHAF